MSIKTGVRGATIIGLSKLSPATALRWLFRIDRWLYYLQGQMAIAYGKGVHVKHRLIAYHDFFVGRIAGHDRVLDVGCGIGALAYDIASHSGASVVGIDVNEASVRTARKRFAHPSVEYVVGDVRKGLPDGRFDVVVLSNVLEHLKDRVAFLRRVQEETGARRMLVRVPLFERDWRVPLKKELGVEWRLDPTHETEYTQESFAKEVASADLVIAYKETRWGEIWAELQPFPGADDANE